MNTNLPGMEWLFPLALIVTGSLLGIIIERFLLKRLIIAAGQKSIPFYEPMLISLQGITFVWFVLAGIYGATVISSLPRDLMSGLHQVVIVILFYSLALLLTRFTRFLLQLWVKRVPAIPASLTANLSRITIFGFTTLIALQSLGIDITAVLTTLGLGGLALALALQDTLANLFAGFYLTISGQVRAGDYVKLETEQEGYIIDISWRNTTIRELSHNLIIVPNAKLSSAIFTNYHLPAKEVTLTFSLGVSYESDLEKVEKITVEVAEEIMQKFSHPDLQFRPFILYENFGDFSIDFTVFLRVNEFLDQRQARHELIKSLHSRYREEGIVIPFPMRDVNLNSKN